MMEVGVVSGDGGGCQVMGVVSGDGGGCGVS